MIRTHIIAMNIKREFWENRRLTIGLPLAISALLLVLSILFTIVSHYEDHFDNDVEISMNSGTPAIPDFPNADGELVMDLDAGSKNVLGESQEDNFWVVGFYLAILWFVAIFYLLSSLRSDRQDNSILFWKSMPVSETETVLSKYLFATVLMVMFTIAIAWLAAAMIYTLVSLGVNHEVLNESDDAGFNVMQIFVWPILLLIVTPVWSALWFSWALLVSARAKRFPVLPFLLLPALLFFLEGVVFRTNVIASFVTNHSPWTLLSAFSSQPTFGQFWTDFVVPRLPSLLLSLAIAGGFLYAAVWQRTQRFET